LRYKETTASPSPARTPQLGAQVEERGRILHPGGTLAGGTCEATGHRLAMSLALAGLAPPRR
jgi:5-enolpyruvylshikimate-3-phosphate synthase